MNSNCVRIDDVPMSTLFLQDNGHICVASNVFSIMNTEFK
jgi:hypothetical protein